MSQEKVVNGSYGSYELMFLLGDGMFAVSFHYLSAKEFLSTPNQNLHATVV